MLMCNSGGNFNQEDREFYDDVLFILSFSTKYNLPYEAISHLLEKMVPAGKNYFALTSNLK